jgi:uncharacterized membrane protein
MPSSQHHPSKPAPRAWAGTLAAAVASTLLAACDQQTAARSPPGDLKLCNTTTSRVGVAIGYQDSEGWTTEGWWNIAAQTCETLYKGTLSSRFYYVHAVDYDRGGEWAGKSTMCTADKAFTIRGVQDCTRRGFKSTGFFEVDTQEANAWTIRLTDPSEGGAKTR